MGELVLGWLRLRGPSSAIDLSVFKDEWARWRKEWNLFFQEFDDIAKITRSHYDNVAAPRPLPNHFPTSMIMPPAIEPWQSMVHCSPPPPAVDTKFLSRLDLEDEPKTPKTPSNTACRSRPSSARSKRSRRSGRVSADWTEEVDEELV